MGAYVTGGGSGIGMACARAFLRDGASVTIVGRSPEKLDAAVESLSGDVAEGAHLGWRSVDVVDEDAVRSSVGAAAEPEGGLHLAVAAAGVGTLAPVIATPLSEWRKVLDTNLTGAFLTLKHAGAAIARSGGGAMCAISSIAGLRTHRHGGAYAVSKAGLDMLVRTTADELGQAGVRVSSVCPGLVDTEISAGLFATDAVLDDYLEQMPVRRTGVVDDVAAAVRYLCGPESGWVTGVSLSVDGGQHLRRGPDWTPIARALYGDDVVEGRHTP
ncbi:SDR family NAD(P)-dependent oxidoreductase [Actinomarinicola tropica]|nr:SDR family oxidoreductase [Actinomarinicola tropica]